MKSVLLVLLSLTIVLQRCTSMVDVALLEFIYDGNDTSALFTEPNAVFDIAEMDLRRKYASVMNITTVRAQDTISTCNPAEHTAEFLAARFYYRELSPNASLGIFFSAPCAMTGPVADLAREWNVPIFIPSRAFGGATTDRFPTGLRLASQNWLAFLNIFLKEFGYTTAGFLCVEELPDRSKCRDLSSTLRWRAEFTAKVFSVNGSDSESLGRTLDEIKSSTRVVFILASEQSIRTIMLTAFDKGMTDGNYVYMTFDRYSRNKPAFLNENPFDEHFADTVTAFRSLFTISANIQNTTEYHDFTNKVKRLSSDKYGRMYVAGEEISLRVASNYFALAIYGQVLNESITNGLDTRDGTSLVKLMHNRTFTILGNEIIINGNGDRESNWVLNQMDPITGFYRPVLTDFDGGKTLRPFRDPVDKSIRPMIWYNRTGPPPNGPM